VSVTRGGIVLDCLCVLGMELPKNGIGGGSSGAIIVVRKDLAPSGSLRDNYSAGARSLPDHYLPYSYLSAIIGSTFVARLAGT
jgi:hypothetical protein